MILVSQTGHRDRYDFVTKVAEPGLLPDVCVCCVLQMRVAGEEDDYRLQLGSYNGTAGDSLSYHQGMRFTTPDRDHDMWWANCGKKDQSGWWFNACSYSSLNGVYHRLDNTTAPRRPSPDGTNTGIQWFEWKSDPAYSLKRVEMKLKPKVAVTLQELGELPDPVYG